MRAHAFDMDGTLLHGTTAPLLLAAALGGGDGLAARKLIGGEAFPRLPRLAAHAGGCQA